jgi:hypothetical protein
MNKNLVKLIKFFSILFIFYGASSGCFGGQGLGADLNDGNQVAPVGMQPKPLESKLDLLRNIKTIADSNLINDPEFLFDEQMVSFFAATDIERGTDSGVDGKSSWIHAICCKNLFPSVQLGPGLSAEVPGVLIMGMRKTTGAGTTNGLRIVIQGEVLIFDDIKSVFGSGIQRERKGLRLHPPARPLGPHGDELWVYESPQFRGHANRVYFNFRDAGPLLTVDIFDGK